MKKTFLNYRWLLIFSLVIISFFVIQSPKIEALPAGSHPGSTPFSCTPGNCTSCLRECNETGNGAIDSEACWTACNNNYIINQTTGVQSAYYSIDGPAIIESTAGDNAEIQLQSTVAGDHWGIYHDRTTEELRFWNGSNLLNLGTTGNVYVTGGLSTYDLTVSDNTIEAGQFCLGNGTDCITSWPVGADGVWSNSEETGFSAGRMFVTETTYSSQLGGLGGADVICQQEAQNAGLGGSWIAFISATPDGLNDIQSRLTALGLANATFTNMAGAVIGTNMNQLFDGGINNAINYGPGGGLVTGEEGVWTGMDNLGRPLDTSCPNYGLSGNCTCNNWTFEDDVAGFTANYGLESKITSQYINEGTSYATCGNDVANKRRLYCVAKTGEAGNNYLYVQNYQVGINVTSPGYPLHVVDNDSTAIINLDNVGADLYTGLRLARDGSEKWFVGVNSTDDKFRIARNGGITEFTIDPATGKVGINTTNPGYDLDVSGYINASSNLCINGDCKNSWAAVAGNYTAGDGLDLTVSDFSLDLKSLGGLAISSTELALRDCTSGQVLKSTGANTWGCSSADYTAGDGLNLNGSQFRLIQTCSSNEVLKYNGTAWACSADAGGTAYTAGNGLDLTVSDFSLDLKTSGGLAISSTELALANCTSGQVLKSTGTNTWGCSADDSGASYWTDQATYIRPSDIADHIATINGNIGVRVIPDYPLSVNDDGLVAIINIDNSGTDLFTGTRLARDGVEKWFIGMSNSSDSLLFRRNGSSNDVSIDTNGTLHLTAAAVGSTDFIKLEVTGEVFDRFSVDRRGFVQAYKGVSTEVLLPENKVYRDNTYNNIYRCGSWSYNGTDYICSSPQVMFANYAGGFDRIYKEGDGFEPSRQHFCNVFAMTETGGTNGDSCNTDGLCAFWDPINSNWNQAPTGISIYWETISCRLF